VLGSKPPTPTPTNLALIGLCNCKVRPTQPSTDIVYRQTTAIRLAKGDDDDDDGEIDIPITKWTGDPGL